MTYLRTKESPAPDRWCEWFPVDHDAQRIRCCDCALVHALQFRVVRGAVEMRARRDNRATAASRRSR